MSDPGTTQVVTRFAPSPTGYLHVGGARTALFNWAFARRHGGKFILRMEDTDRARSTPEATRQIIEDLKWLGLADWDEGPDPNAADPYKACRGERGPYFQSQRGEIYQEHLQKLIAAGRAYEDKGAYRFKMPGKDITVHDLVLGDVTITAAQLEDFVIFKSAAAGEAAGGPTFHFANVVDDATMGVTHVLRAQEHLMNTPKHLALFEAFEIAPPKYAHMPLIFNPDGSKMSKRDKAKAARQAAQEWIKRHAKSPAEFVQDVHRQWELARKTASPPERELPEAHIEGFLAKDHDDPDAVRAIALGLASLLQLPEIDVHDFRVSGYLPEVLLNYLALLGWSPGSNVEHFDLKYLKREFDLERLGKSPAKFDRQKLLAFNAEQLAGLSPEVFAEQLRPYLAQQERFAELANNPERFKLFAECYRPRAKTLRDAAVAGRFFVVSDGEIKFDPKAMEKILKKNDNAGAKVLDELARELYKLQEWTPANIHSVVEHFAQSRGLGMGDVAQPLRVAVTGTTVSPAIHDTLAILGREATLARIDRCLLEAK